jgi:hypothetical protein
MESGGSPISIDRRRNGGASKHTEGTIVCENGFLVDIIYNFMTSRLKYCFFFTFYSITNYIRVVSINAYIVVMALIPEKRCITIYVISIQIRWQRLSFELQALVR